MDRGFQRDAQGCLVVCVPFHVERSSGQQRPPMRWASLFLGLLFGVAPGEASGERFIAGSKGLAGSVIALRSRLVRSPRRNASS